jgi:hypothetical protein
MDSVPYVNVCGALRCRSCNSGQLGHSGHARVSNGCPLLFASVSHCQSATCVAPQTQSVLDPKRAQAINFASNALRRGGLALEDIGPGMSHGSEISRTQAACGGQNLPGL